MATLLVRAVVLLASTIAATDASATPLSLPASAATAECACDPLSDVSQFTTCKV